MSATELDELHRLMDSMIAKNGKEIAQEAIIKNIVWNAKYLSKENLELVTRQLAELHPDRLHVC